MRAFLVRHRYFLIFYCGSFLYFLWPLIRLREAFLFGDYQAQVLPWLWELSRSLSDGELPFWTERMAGGYPLVAEGQIAAYYPVHWALFLLLPFRAAYTWSVPLHLLIGAFGMRAYLRRIGLSEQAAVMGSLLFSFSSLYGGNFYVIATLRTLAWLPWLLWAAEKMRDRNGRSSGTLLAASILTYLIWNGGFAQLALYALAYTGVYVLIRLFGDLRAMGLSLAALVIGTALSVPQLGVTRELIGNSARASSDLAFALWGSVAPPALSSFVFPEWGRLLRVSAYAGILPLYLAAAGAVTAARRSPAMAHLLLCALFFAAALGKYNPLYVAFLKASGLYMLRTPSKFLFFGIFSLITLAVCGWDMLRSGVARGGRARLIGRIWILMTALAVLAPAAGYWMRGPGHERLLRMGQEEAQRIHGEKSDPLYSVSQYADRAQTVIADLSQAIDYLNPWVLYALGGCALSWFIARRLSADKTERTAVIAFIFLSVDLVLFGRLWGTGFIGNARPWQEAPHPAIQRLAHLQKDSGGLAVEWSGGSAKEIMPPNAGMRWDVAQAGGYTPLLLRRYSEAYAPYGIADASLGRKPMDEAVWRDAWGMLDVLGISWVLSDRALTWEWLTPQDQVQGRWIYRNHGAMPEFFVLDRWRSIADVSSRLSFLRSAQFDPRKEAIVEDETPPAGSEKAGMMLPAAWIVDSDGSLSFEVNVDHAAIAVFRKPLYPRWKLMLDGKEAKIVPVDHVLSGAFLERGTHRGRLYYDRSFHRTLEAGAFWLFALLCGFCVWTARHRIRLWAWKESLAAAWLLAVLILYWASVWLPKISARGMM